MADLRSLLFPAGTEAGLLLDPSDGATGFQESAGTTPGVLNSPTGLRLDKRLGLARGANVVVNGDFASSTGWGAGAGWAIAGGSAQSTGTGFLNRADGPSSGMRTYAYSLTISNYVSGSVAIYLNGPAIPSSAAMTGNGTFTGVISTTAADGNLGLASSAFTGSVDDFALYPISGNHVLQATAAARPVWKLNGAIYSDLFDPVDDGYATAAFAAGTLTADMDCFIAIKRNSAGDGLVCSDAAGTALFGAFKLGSANNATQGGGLSSTYWVDGVQLAGGTSVTQGTVDTALPSGSWKVMEVRNLNLSAWTQMRISLFTAFFLNADIGPIALCPAKTDAIRARARTIIGAKVGLVL